MSATPRPWKVMYDSNIGPCIHDADGIAIMGGDPDALAEAARAFNAHDALVEALSRFCTNDWADEFRANGYGNCAGCGVGVDDIHVDAEHPSVDHGPRCAVLQGRAALRQAGALE